MADMAGKVALVTGGASGMGRIIALRLAGRGAQVAIFDVNAQGLEDTAAEHANIRPFSCDISSLEDVEAKVAEVAAELGPIDHVVHAAALMPGHKLMDHTHEGMARLFQINYFGTTYMARAVLPAMLERRSGRFIVFGSIAGHAMVPNMGAYCATKSAVNTYMEVLQNELRDSGVNIHLVCPPAVNTPLVDQALATDSPGSIIEAKEKVDWPIPKRSSTPSIKAWPRIRILSIPVRLDCCNFGTPCCHGCGGKPSCNSKSKPHFFPLVAGRGVTMAGQ